MSKRDFDTAVKNAQEALRAKTSSSQAMLQQASSAMRNAVTALSLSEQEVANLRQSVHELKQQRDVAVRRRRVGDCPAMAGAPEREASNTPTYRQNTP